MGHNTRARVSYLVGGEMANFFQLEILEYIGHLIKWHQNFVIVTSLRRYRTVVFYEFIYNSTSSLKESSK